MAKLENIEPKGLWNNFEKINAVPRPSKKEERIIAMVIEFGKSLNLSQIKKQTLK